MEEELKAKVGLTESSDYVCLEDLQQTQNFAGISPINLDYLGSEQCRSGYSFGPYVRENYVMHIVRSGHGVLKKNDRVYKVGTNQAFLIYPGENVTYQADVKDPWNYVWVGFHGFRCEEIVMHAGFSRENPVITVQDMEQCGAILKDMLLALDLTFSSEMTRTGGLYMLMGLLAGAAEKKNRASARSTRTQDHMYVERAVEVMSRSFRTHLRVGDVAKQIGISRNYLSSIFKKEMGVSPQEFLIDYRMEAAAALLRDTENPVNVVALEVGYGDPLSFSKAFRKKYKMSPTEYRENKPELTEHSRKGEYTGKYPL